MFVDYLSYRAELVDMWIVCDTVETRRGYRDVGETIIFHLGHVVVDFRRHFLLYCVAFAEKEALCETFRSNL